MTEDGPTMKLTGYIFCAVLLVACAQGIHAKNLDNFEENICRTNALANANLRGISDVWRKIREGAIATWNYIKEVGEYTKGKIKLFINNVKQYSIELKDKFAQKLQEFKDKVQNIISDIYGTGELVKQCMAKEKENIERILKQLMANMGQCIAEEINQLNFLENDPEPTLNQTLFITNLDSRKEMCETDMVNVQECLCNVRKEIFDNFTGMENKLLQNHFEARSFTDDIKGTLVTCSINNLMDATTMISTEIVEIAQCVAEAKFNQNEKPESMN